MSPPVVVSGLGVWSAAGAGTAALGAALRADRCCAVPADSALPVGSVAVVPEPVPPVRGYPDDRKAWLAFAALEEALADAGLPRAAPPDERRSVFLGTGLSSITPGELTEDIYAHLIDGGTRLDHAAMARDLSRDHAAPWRHMPERVTSGFTELLGARGPCGTSFSACAAASQAIGAGLRAVRSGEADVAFVGGQDSMLHPLGLLSFVVLGALSPEAGRPFDRRRDGFLIGEGAMVAVLERADRAAARGARARAIVLGAATSADAWNATAPHPDGRGAELAMRRALRDAGLEPADIDHINTHGTGTPVGDLAEAKAIRRVFGERVAVSSIKGAIGHTIAAAGALEAAASILGLEGGWLPGTVGFGEADPECRVNVLAGSVERSARFVLSNSFGFGGQNSCIVLGCA